MVLHLLDLNHVQNLQVLVAQVQVLTIPGIYYLYNTYLTYPIINTFLYFIGIEIVDVGLDQEVGDDEGQKVMTDVVDLGVMKGDGQEGVKNEKDIEETIGVTMAVEMIIVHAVALREEIEDLTDVIVQLEKRINIGKVQLRRILNKGRVQ